MAFRINRFHNPGWILAFTLATKTYRSRSVCINKFQHPGWIPEIQLESQAPTLSTICQTEKPSWQQRTSYTSMEALLTHSCGPFSPWLNSMISSRWPSAKSVSHQKTFMTAIVKLNSMISSRWQSAKSASNKKAFRTPPFWCCITRNCNLHVWVLQHKMAISQECIWDLSWERRL